MDGVDEAAQLGLYSVADRQPVQMDHGRRDMVGATQAEYFRAAAFWTRCRSCSVDVGTVGHRGIQTGATFADMAIHFLRVIDKMILPRTQNELLDTVKARKLAYCGHTMRKQGSCLDKEIMPGTTPGARRRGRRRTAWMDNIKTWTGLPVEESE